jgi:hypothetical protein
MNRLLAPLGLVVALWSGSAAAQRKPWVAVETHAQWTRIANGPNVTGGFGPKASASYVWPVSAHTRLALGADLSVSIPVRGVTIAPGLHYVGVLGGPLASVAGEPWLAPVTVGLAFGVPFGKVPICNRWKTPFCPNMIGAFPALVLAGLWRAENGAGVGIDVGAQLFNSPAGLIVGVTSSVVGVVAFGK